ncbi:MAG: phage replication protein [Pseudomonadota bacterium]
MARARNIKPSFFTNDDLSNVSAFGRLLFIGLWTIADREGRLEDRPKKIKAEVLPYDECDCNELLSDLEKHGFLIRYEHGNVKYIQILTFTKHQNPHIKEADSTIPEPCLSSANTVQSTTLTGTSHADSLLPITDSLLPIKTSRINALDDGFNEFWLAYPKKVGKDKAQIAWHKKKPKIDLVLKALHWQKTSDSWQQGYIPNPTTYINEGRWKDEPPAERYAF